MRIGIINKFCYVTGGADRHCLDLAAILRDAGHDVAFLSTRAPEQLESQGAFIPLTVANTTRDQLGLSTCARVATRSIWNRTAQAATIRFFEDFGPEVLSVHKVYPQLSVAPLIEAERRGIPVVQTLHDYEFLAANPFDPEGGLIDRGESRARYKALNTSLFVLKRWRHKRAVTRWVAVSRAVAGTYGTHAIKASAIPNFTLVGGDEPPGRENRTGVLYVGRLTAEKGIEAVIALARQAPDVPVTVIGQGSLAPVVTQAAAALPNLVYLGQQSQAAVQEALRSSVACLMPSTWLEPGPLASIEAMAAGTPVVCFRCGGLSEYVDDADAGIVCDGHPGTFAEASRRLLDDSSLWQRLSANGRQAIRKQHSPTTYLKRIVGEYEAALSASGSR